MFENVLPLLILAVVNPAIVVVPVITALPVFENVPPLLILAAVKPATIVVP